MKRTVKWENDSGLKVEFSFADSNGTVNMTTKALRMSAKKTRFVPFKVFAVQTKDGMGTTHTSTQKLPSSRKEDLLPAMQEHIKNVKAEYADIAASRTLVDGVVDGLLENKEMGFTEVFAPIPNKKDAPVEADAEDEGIEADAEDEGVEADAEDEGVEADAEETETE